MHAIRTSKKWSRALGADVLAKIDRLAANCDDITQGGRKCVTSMRFASTDPVRPKFKHQELDNAEYEVKQDCSIYCLDKAEVWAEDILTHVPSRGTATLITREAQLWPSVEKSIAEADDAEAALVDFHHRHEHDMSEHMGEFGALNKKAQTTRDHANKLSVELQTAIQADASEAPHHIAAAASSSSSNPLIWDLELQKAEIRISTPGEPLFTLNWLKTQYLWQYRKNLGRRRTREEIAEQVARDGHDHYVADIKEDAGLGFVPLLTQTIRLPGGKEMELACEMRLLCPRELSYEEMNRTSVHELGELDWPEFDALAWSSDNKWRLWFVSPVARKIIRKGDEFFAYTVSLSSTLRFRVSREYVAAALPAEEEDVEEEREQVDDEEDDDVSVQRSAKSRSHKRIRISDDDDDEEEEVPRRKPETKSTSRRRIRIRDEDEEENPSDESGERSSKKAKYVHVMQQEEEEGEESYVPRPSKRRSKLMRPEDVDMLPPADGEDLNEETVELALEGLLESQMRYVIRKLKLPITITRAPLERQPAKIVKAILDQGISIDRASKMVKRAGKRAPTQDPVAPAAASSSDAADEAEQELNEAYDAVEKIENSRLRQILHAASLVSMDASKALVRDELIRRVRKGMDRGTIVLESFQRVLDRQTAADEVEERAKERRALLHEHAMKHKQERVAQSQDAASSSSAVNHSTAVVAHVNHSDPRIDEILRANLTVTTAVPPCTISIAKPDSSRLRTGRLLVRSMFSARADRLATEAAAAGAPSIAQWCDWIVEMIRSYDTDLFGDMLRPFFEQSGVVIRVGGHAAGEGEVVEVSSANSIWQLRLNLEKLLQPGIVPVEVDGVQCMDRLHLVQMLVERRLHECLVELGCKSLAPAAKPRAPRKQKQKQEQVSETEWLFRAWSGAIVNRNFPDEWFNDILEGLDSPTFNWWSAVQECIKKTRGSIDPAILAIHDANAHNKHHIMTSRASAFEKGLPSDSRSINHGGLASLGLVDMLLHIREQWPSEQMIKFLNLVEHAISSYGKSLKPDAYRGYAEMYYDSLTKCTRFALQMEALRVMGWDEWKARGVETMAAKTLHALMRELLEARRLRVFVRDDANCKGKSPEDNVLRMARMMQPGTLLPLAFRVGYEVNKYQQALRLDQIEKWNYFLPFPNTFTATLQHKLVIPGVETLEIGTRLTFDRDYDDRYKIARWSSRASYYRVTVDLDDSVASSAPFERPAAASSSAASAASATSAPAPIQSTLRLCPNCGAPPASTTAKFCGDCGTRL